MMNAYLQATVTVLALINPAMCASLFAGAESGLHERLRLGLRHGDET